MKKHPRVVGTSQPTTSESSSDEDDEEEENNMPSFDDTENPEDVEPATDEEISDLIRSATG